MSDSFDRTGDRRGRDGATGDRATGDRPVGGRATGDRLARDDRDGPRRPPDSNAARARERLSAEYDEEDTPRRRSGQGGVLSGLLGSDALTRRLAYGAGGVAALLILAIGGWSVFGPRQSGIPVIGPPGWPARDKPADPGGMQIMTNDDGQVDTTGQGEAHLAPGPEQPRPDALAQQYGGGADQAAPKTVPAPASPSPAPSARQTDAPAAAPKPIAPKPAAPAAGTPVPEAAKPPSAAAPSAAPTAAAPQPDGKFMVQLAALDSAAEAHRQWDTLQHQAPDLFSARAPLIETVTHEGRTYYRLRLRGFESVAAARAFCIKAHARSIACTPAQF